MTSQHKEIRDSKGLLQEASGVKLKKNKSLLTLHAYS